MNMTFVIGLFLFCLMVSVNALAEENPDELYKQGRFEEAEKSYALLDMDHPKDIRYRYNRGCAAYQKGDPQGAVAAFSSVLRRTKDKDVMFRSAYNLGNTAYKQGDFESAVSYYKQSILYNPSNGDARYNLELALRALEKQKKKNEQSPPQSQDDGEKGEEKKSPSDSDEKQDGKQKPSEAKPSKPSKPEDQEGDKDKKDAANEKQPEEKAEGKPEGKQDRRRKAEQQSPKDLSGELKSLQDQAGQQEEDQPPVPGMSTIDRKKAEALLDNIKEDRSRFLRFQIPKEKRYGVASGKDW